MSDIRCVVCGEPWDAYGVSHGDMYAWEADLFRKGAGCPCCKGERPEEPPKFESVFDFENGDEDEMQRIAAHESANSPNPPKWEEPEAVILWVCDACGVQVVRDTSEEYYNGRKKEGAEVLYRIPVGARCAEWYSSHPFGVRGNNPDETPAHTFNNGKEVCEYCLDHCKKCGKAVSKTLETDDAYDEGWCGTPEGYYPDVFCIDCVETLCDECGCFESDCTCHETKNEDEDEESE